MEMSSSSSSQFINDLNYANESFNLPRKFSRSNIDFDYFSNNDDQDDSCSATSLSSFTTGMLLQSNMDINNNDPLVFNHFQKSLSRQSSLAGTPPPSSQDSGIGFSSPGSTYHVPGSLSSSTTTTSSSTPSTCTTSDDRTETRRLKNRESAARSRQKIKNLLQQLETQQKRLQSKKQAMENEKCTAMKEVDRLEYAMLNMKIRKVSDALKSKVEDYDLTWNSFAQCIPEMSGNLVELNLLVKEEPFST